jgi:peptidoglycan hydrolase-like protein with peptidoglycan-binding domain
MHDGAQKKIQDRLRARRLLAADQCTGEFNLQTRDALRAFQKREGLPATGLPSYETVEHLGLDLDKIFRSTQHAEAPPRRAPSPR